MTEPDRYSENWHSFETAPTDGTEVFVADRSLSPYAYRARYDGGWQFLENVSRDFTPTHWHPIA